MDNENRQDNEREELTTVGHPICCPNCMSKNISFVAEYHKYLGLRIACYILFGILAALIYGHIWDFVKNQKSDPLHITASICCTILIIIFEIIIAAGEQRTHIKAICRDCGKIWLID